MNKEKEVEKAAQIIKYKGVNGYFVETTMDSNSETVLFLLQGVHKAIENLLTSNIKNMNCIERKITIWERIFFNKSLELEEIKNEISKDVNYNIFDHPDFESSEFLYDTIETINPEDNYNMPTVELYEDQTLIWDNSVKE